ncbi:MAG TPA: metalloregulator ArsR/SmtB family transcription factor [Gaiellaceae bacterium]|nr:metalloregulator ArsR/SmtB family transcription factor [Gaiellaceae bacterium]
MSRVAAGSDAFHAIAEENRRALLDILREGELPVGGLVTATGLSYSLVSQHLGVLLDAGVVVRRPEGGILLSLQQPWPTSFFISSISFAFYLGARMAEQVRLRRRRAVPAEALARS